MTLVSIEIIENYTVNYDTYYTMFKYMYQLQNIFRGMKVYTVKGTTAYN